MPIQSTPVTTQSTINLSDINIDTDLDMGTHKLTVPELITNDIDNIKINSKNLSNYIPMLDYENRLLYKINRTAVATFTDPTYYETTSDSLTTLATIPITDIPNLIDDGSQNYYIIATIQSKSNKNGYTATGSICYDNTSTIWVSGGNSTTSYVTHTARLISTVDSSKNFYIRGKGGSTFTSSIGNAIIKFYDYETTDDVVF